MVDMVCQKQNFLSLLKQRGDEDSIDIRTRTVSVSLTPNNSHAWGFQKRQENLISTLHSQLYCSCGLRVLECGIRSVPSKKNFNYTRVRKSESYAPSYTMHIVQLLKSEATVRKKEKSKPEPGRGPSECTVVFIKTEF